MPVQYYPALGDLSVPAPDPGPADWNDEGVVYLPGLIPPDLIAAYQDAWKAAHGFRGLRAPDYGEGGSWTRDAALDPTSDPLWVLDADRPGGWNEACPYMHTPQLLDVCCYPPLAAALQATVGEAMGLHLNLTGWVSTRRNWHQDGYLNPEYVGDRYAAVWIALGDVHADSGVFQYIPGSHRWHRLTRDLIGRYVNLADPMWPQHTEAVLTDLVQNEIQERDATVIDYRPSAGDVLLWHPRLYHRGTVAALTNAYRPALIAHYSGVTARPDMPGPLVHMEARTFGDRGVPGSFFPIDTSGPVR